MSCQGSWIRDAIREPTVGHAQRSLSFVAAQLFTVSLPNHALEATAYAPRVDIRCLILVRCQVETNYPRPCANASHARFIGGQSWQASFQGSHNSRHI